MTALVLSDSPFDSKRFNIKVMRGTAEGRSVHDAVVAEIDQAPADLVIFRVPAGETSVPTTLARMGHTVIHADTLVYYGMDLNGMTSLASPDHVRQATPEDSSAISAIAKDSFTGYRSHYSANPLLSKELVHAGYVEWALSRLDDQQLSSTWVAEFDGQVAGFATCDADAHQVEIVLNAVHPDFERRGLYGALLRKIICHHSEQSLSRLVISTQIWNYTVQRQWTKAGLQLFKAYDTYHLDRRLAAAGASQ